LTKNEFNSKFSIWGIVYGRIYIIYRSINFYSLFTLYKIKIKLRYLLNDYITIEMERNIYE